MFSSLTMAQHTMFVSFLGLSELFSQEKINHAYPFRSNPTIRVNVMSRKKETIRDLVSHMVPA
jgi:hypothetical protein